MHLDAAAQRQVGAVVGTCEVLLLRFSSRNKQQHHPLREGRGVGGLRKRLGSAPWAVGSKWTRKCSRALVLKVRALSLVVGDSPANFRPSGQMLSSWRLRLTQNWGFV